MGVSSLYTSTISLDDLKSKVGKVSTLKEEVRTSRGNKSYYLFIRFQYENTKYRIYNDVEPGSDLYKKLKLNISYGDIIKVYYRSDFQNLIGLGLKNDIYHIEKGFETLLSIDSMNHKDMMLGLFFILISALLFYFRYRKNQKVV